MSSRDFNEELGYSVINPGTVVGAEFAPPGVACGSNSDLPKFSVAIKLVLLPF